MREKGRRECDTKKSCSSCCCSPLFFLSFFRRPYILHKLARSRQRAEGRNAKTGTASLPGSVGMLSSRIISNADRQHSLSFSLLAPSPLFFPFCRQVDHGGFSSRLTEGKERRNDLVRSSKERRRGPSPPLFFLSSLRAQEEEVPSLLLLGDTRYPDLSRPPARQEREGRGGGGVLRSEAKRQRDCLRALLLLGGPCSSSVGARAKERGLLGNIYREEGASEGDVYLLLYLSSNMSPNRREREGRRGGNEGKKLGIKKVKEERKATENKFRLLLISSS